MYLTLLPHRSTATARSGIRLAGLGLALGAAASVVVEAIVAAGWGDPAYSYVSDKVSALGSPYCGPYDGQVVCSPGWLAMLVTWVANGVLVGLAGWVVGRAIGGRAGAVVRAVAALEAIGFVLFALFHDSPDARADGTIGLYFTGAALVLVTANALAILVGRANRRLGLARWLGPTSVALGAFGLLAAVATLGWAPLGLAERLSIYPFLLWQLLLGSRLLRSRPTA